ncbi:MAG: ATP-binding cassette domain-containing protein [Inquilinus sp.]|nr:ATP-binding cassette domain-containing protein [Inquilinus sp.]
MTGERNGGDRDPVLDVRDVSKSYGAIRALDGVSLRVDNGEMVALLGPNGAGKTTLFQLLSGLFVADAGSILIEGHDIRHNAVPALAAIGIVFQQPTLDLDMTIAGNLRFHARLHGLGRRLARQRIDEELARVGLTERRADAARQLSGGNRRRIELARALLPRPRLLLMDEPTVGLDPASRADLLDHILRLRADRHLGVLWATHLVDEAERADRVVILDRGRVLRSGTPAALVEGSATATLSDAFLRLTATGATPA